MFWKMASNKCFACSADVRRRLNDYLGLVDNILHN